MDRMKLFSLLTVAVLAVVAPAHATVFEVSIADFEFVPAAITVAVGDSIHWTNNGAAPHTVTSGADCTWDNDFDSGTLNPGQEFGYKVDEEDAGDTVDYFCRFHCAMGMVGSYTVQELNPVEPATWGKIKSLYR